MLLLSLGLLEVGLQVASRFAEDRTSVWTPGARQRVLCVGDSHTWGVGVAREESYPARLQELLDEAEPGAYSVINHGLPGMNTAQIRRRLPVWLQRYQPDVLVVWAGVNNAWNRADSEEGSGVAWAWAEGILGHSRVYRLIRVWLHDRKLARYVASERADRVFDRVDARAPLGPKARFTVRYDGVIEEIHHDGVRSLLESEGEARVEAWVERDLAFLAEAARSAGVDLVLLTYPIEAAWFASVNQIARRTASRYDVPLVETGPAAQRLDPEQADWLPDAHPGANVYREIAREVAQRLRSRTAATD
jgi:lysophospholipase L1-like esterase